MMCRAGPGLQRVFPEGFFCLLLKLAGIPQRGVRVRVRVCMCMCVRVPAHET